MVETENKAFEDLVKAQTAVGVVLKDQDNPYFKSKYVDINGLLSSIKPALNKNNFTLIQSLTTIDGRLGMRTMLIHTSGVKIEDSCPLPETPDAQKAGSAITYFRRYSIQSLLAVEAQDDDANLATGKVAEAKPEPVKPVKKAKVEKPEPVKTVYPAPSINLDDIPF